ncbi:MAG TPA: N-acetylmuramic acid 6-phosphate etherase [Candidatus Brocadiia bacterium]|nr:N-acetylmuramic acid 6-phosphate etherase [Candidatus Brocadiales bacterium]
MLNIVVYRKIAKTMDMDRSKLVTEQRNPNTNDIDGKTTIEIVDIINAEDKKVIGAVHRERHNIAKAIDLTVEAFKNGGRLFYVGAGTSGRLGVLDASECPPTFGTDPGLVCGIIAGGEPALTRSVEGAEDNEGDGVRVIRDKGVNHKDAVMGIATGGTTPFVLGALLEAKRIGAKIIFLTCNPNPSLVGARCNVPLQQADVIINPITGPEVITGSTRMKAGTATKLVLNTLTTTIMIKMGKVYQNLMVDLCATNEKLKDRAERIVMTASGLDRSSSSMLLKNAGGNAKVAIVMHALKINREDAVKRLAEHNGFVREVIKNPENK